MDYHPDFDPEPALDLISSIEANLDRLKILIQPPPSELDPMDPRNKTADGKLTPQGVAVCYRLFEEGKTRYAVAKAMGISFGAATHRLRALKKAELIKLGLQRGPKQYVAFDELARRIRDNPSSWNPEKGPWFWNHLECTRAPYAIEMEWALLQWSRQINDNCDPELERAQEARVEELERYLERDPDSLEIKCHDAIRRELDSVGGVMQLRQG